MAKADGGELIARVMRENRVKYCFTINGGHLSPILANCAATTSSSSICATNRPPPTLPTHTRAVRAKSAYAW